jgi:hypothetical protein
LQVDDLPQLLSEQRKHCGTVPGQPIFSRDPRWFAGNDRISRIFRNWLSSAAIRLATRATIPVKYPLPGYFVDLVILRMPAIRLMVMSTRMAGSAGPRPRFNAHRVPCY